MGFAGTIGQPPCATIALILLDGGLGGLDVSAGKRRHAERRIGDQHHLRVVERKLVRVRCIRRGRSRAIALTIPPAAAEEREESVIAALIAAAVAAAAVAAGSCRSTTRTGRRSMARRCRGEAPWPSLRRRRRLRPSVDSANSACGRSPSVAASVPLNYKRFAVSTLVPMIPELCLPTARSRFEFQEHELLS